MMSFGSNKKNLCEEFNCKVTKTENGIKMSLSSEDKEKIERLHKMTDSCMSFYCDCDDGSKSGSCC